MTIAYAHLIDPAVTRWYHCPGAPGLREVAGRLGLRRAVNLGSCLVT
jgi:hypothetical protein